MNINLKNKKAIVCGSTQGIGKAVALELASLGAEIILVTRDEKTLVSNIVKILYEELCDSMNNSNILMKVLEYADKNNLNKDETLDKIYSKIEKQFKLKIQNTSQFISH